MNTPLRITLASLTLLGFALGCAGRSDTTADTIDAVQCDGGCEPPRGVGAPCAPADENRASFAGYSAAEVAVEDLSAQCDTGICLAYHFQGRTDCPYGTGCTTASGTPVTASVEPQLVDRPPSSAVYCSCRCAGPAGSGPFCPCPDGFACEEVVPDLGLGSNELVGSYCVMTGTRVPDPASLAAAPTCEVSARNCEGR